MLIGPLKLKLQLVCGDSFAMGPGKADLLEAIDREGSIKAAGRVLGMSYRRTWLLVDEMNRCFSERLVDTLAGGGRERGARLSAQGRTVLEAYRELEAVTAQVTGSAAYERLVAGLLDQPRPPKSGSAVSEPAPPLR
ncbi:ModE family transcriptional regulator [Croceibacterium sp. TMG7-5b_MA50]|uniref:winged helix-turn-helix domain-containing protein n=1 Tax=Croceibacterium sp. TMG7-5b_MA50 TaxID=3121290 RepID=UPI0032218276